MKDYLNEESSSDSSFTNSFGSEKSPIVEFSPTEKPKDDRTVSANSEASDTLASLCITGFRIVKLLGRGGMGVVYEAIEEELNRRVALKVLPASALLDSRQIARFKHEARAVAQLHHENIVPIYKVGSDQGIHYYTMQLIDGQNLSQIISSIKNHVKNDPKSSREDSKRRTAAKSKEDRKKEDRSPGIVPGSSSRRRFRIEELASALTSRRGGSHDLSMYQSIAEFGAEIATALSHAHDHGVIHRDIKPSNILVDETSKPWVADFGLAMVRDNSVATKPGDIVGTYRYMSPEQATGRRFLIDHRTDIYSLGVTLYELVTQSVPFPGTQPHELLRQVSFDEPKSVRSANPAIPEELQIIITKAIAKNPHDRYETAHDFADDLRRFATGRPIQAKRASVVKQLRRWMGRHQGFVLAASLVLLMTFVTSIAASAMIWNAYESEHQQLVIAEEALDRSEGMRLAAKSQQMIPKNPSLAVSLSVESAKRASGPEINSTMLEALAATYERKTLYPKDLQGRSLELSPDGRLAVGLLSTKDSTSGSAVVLDLQSSTTQLTIAGREPFSHVLFHPSGNTVLTASSSNPSRDENGVLNWKASAATLWSVNKSDQQILLKDSEPLLLQRSCFSQDGKAIVLPSSDQTVSIYDGTTGERTLVFQLHKARVMLAVISADGRTAASLDTSGQVWFWNAIDGTVKGQLDVREMVKSVPKLHLTANGSHLVFTTDDGSTCYSVSNDKPSRVAKWREPQFEPHPVLPLGVCYWTATGTVHLRNLSTGQSLSEIQLPHAPQLISYTRDGKHLLAAVNENVHVIEPFSGTVQVVLRGHTGQVLKVTSDNDFQTIVTSGTDRSLRLWSDLPLLALGVLPQPALMRIPNRDHWVTTENSICIATDPSTETSAIEMDSAKLRQIGPGKQPKSNKRFNRIVLYQDHSVRIVDSISARKVQEVSFPNSAIVEASYCGDSELVLIKLKSGGWFTWNLADKSLNKLQLGRDEPTEHSISPDGTQVVVTGHDGICSIHSLSDGKMLRLLPHDEMVHAVEWLKTGGLLTLDSKRHLRLWSNWKEVLEPKWTAKTDDANSITVMDSADLVVTFNSLKENKVECWSVDSGQLKHSTHGGLLQRVTQHPKQSLVLLTSVKGASLWELTNGERADLSSKHSIVGAFVGNSVVTAEAGIEKHAHTHPTFFHSDSGSCTLSFFSLDSKAQQRSIQLDRVPIELSVDRETEVLYLSYTAWHASILDRRSNAQHLSPTFSSNVSVIRYLARSKRWMVASTDGTVLLLDDTGKLIKSMLSGPPIVTMCVSSDDRLVATGDLQGRIRVIEIESGSSVLDENLPQSPPKQMEFVDLDRGLLVLSQNGNLDKLSLGKEPPLRYSAPAGIQAFVLFNARANALLICGSDLLNPPVTDGNVSVASTKSNVSVGMAQQLDISKFQALEVDSREAKFGDVNPGNSEIALFTSSGKIVIYQTDPLTLKKEWEVGVDRVNALRWVGKDRLATLSRNETISVWNTAMGELVLEVEPVSRSPINYASYRFQWSPLDPWTDSLQLFDGQENRVLSYPLNPQEFANKHAPRSLLEAEARLYLNPMLIKQD